jgi:hypothetical protein
MSQNGGVTPLGGCRKIPVNVYIFPVSFCGHLLGVICVTYICVDFIVIFMFIVYCNNTVVLHSPRQPPSSLLPSQI